jgi:hypothetical protein
LTRRIVWFERRDGERAAPKENHAWYCWQSTPVRTCLPPLTLYAPEQRPHLNRDPACNLAFRLRQRLAPYIMDGSERHALFEELAQRVQQGLAEFDHQKRKELLGEHGDIRSIPSEAWSRFSEERLAWEQYHYGSERKS